MNNYLLFNGDCLEIMDRIPEGSIDMVIADLPDGTLTSNFNEPIDLVELWKKYERITTDNAVIVLTARQPYSSQLVVSNLELFKYEWIWETDKKNTKFLIVNRRPLQVHESILVFFKNKSIFEPQKTNKANLRKIADQDNSIKHYPRSVQYFEDDIQILKFHKTQKPLALQEYLIKTYTKKDMVVLDNVMGCGATGMAALNQDRKFIGIEIDNHYFNIAKENLEIAANIQQQRAEMNKPKRKYLKRNQVQS